MEEFPRLPDYEIFDYSLKVSNSYKTNRIQIYRAVQKYHRQSPFECNEKTQLRSKILAVCSGLTKLFRLQATGSGVWTGDGRNRTEHVNHGLHLVGFAQFFLARPSHLKMSRLSIEADRSELVKHRSDAD